MRVKMITTIVGTAAATALVMAALPVTADIVGKNAGSVTISSPQRGPNGNKASSGFYIGPRTSHSGNIDIDKVRITVKKGSKVLYKNVEDVPKIGAGTYSVTTKVRYRYVRAERQEVEVVSKGAVVQDITGKDADGGEGFEPAIILKSCTLTAVDTGAGTFTGKCDAYLQRWVWSFEEVFDQGAPEKIGTLNGIVGEFDTGTLQGTTQGDDDATVTLAAATVGAAFTPTKIVATESLRAPFFNLVQMGGYKLATKTHKITLKR